MDRLDLVLSRHPLGKDRAHAPLEHRVSVLEAVAATRPWLAVRVTDQQLIVEVAAGYDAVVLGADKWLQVNDPAWYDHSPAARDQALAALPRVLLVARPPHPVPTGLPPGAMLLHVAPGHGEVSSSGVRSGRHDWMAAEALEAGGWSSGALGCPDRPEPAD